MFPDKPVREGVLELVGVGQQIHVVHHNGFAKTIGAGCVAVINTRFDNVTPPSEAALELGSGKLHSVIEDKPVEGVIGEVRPPGICIESLAHTEAMAPVEGVRAQNGDL